MDPASPRRALPHVPALDGLRGLAVVGVLLFHDGRLPGGYLGVDLFFVLSGYLITALLLFEWRATGRIDLGAFWVRRARRLLPAVLVVLVAVAGWARFGAEARDAARIRGDGLATLAYVANWHAIFSTRSYWELFRAPSPLDHTWSLAIEEQFYVIWPLLVALVLWVARGSARALALVSLALAVVSGALLWRFAQAGATSRAYFGTDARGSSILVGAALACAWAPGVTVGGALARRALDAAAAVALAALALAWVRLDGQSPWLYTGGLWATEAAALVVLGACVAVPGGVVARLLSSRPLALAGLVSYGVYLWHWPVFVVLSEARVHAPLARSLLRLAATLAIAVPSYRLLEQPIRRRGLPFGKPALVVPGAFALVAVALVAGTSRAVPPAPEPHAAAAANDGELTGPAPATRVLVVGDSVAVALGERLRLVTPRREATIVVRALGDCSLLEGVLPTRSLNERAHDGGNCAARWAEDAAEVRPTTTLVVLGGGFFARAQVGRSWQRACDAGWQRAFEGELGRRLASLAPVAGHLVVAIAPYPVGAWADATPRRLVDCVNDALRGGVRRTPGATTLELLDHVCPGGACTVESEGEPVRPDGLHFDGRGADATARWVREQLR